MGHVRDSVQIEAESTAVFELAIDPLRWPEWQTTTVEAKGVDGPLDTVGKTYRIVVSFAGQKLEGNGRVTKFERPEVFEVLGSAPGGGRLVSRTTLEEWDGGTRATIEIDYELPGGFMAQLLGPVIGRQIEMEVRQSALNLKSLAEASHPAR